MCIKGVRFCQGLINLWFIPRAAAQIRGHAGLPLPGPTVLLGVSRVTPCPHPTACRGMQGGGLQNEGGGEALLVTFLAFGWATSLIAASFCCQSTRWLMLLYDYEKNNTVFRRRTSPAISEVLWVEPELNHSSSERFVQTLRGGLIRSLRSDAYLQFPN